MAATAMKTTLELSDACKAKFFELKTRRKHRWIVMSVDESALRIDLEAVGDRASTLRKLTDALPTAACRFAVFDHDYSRPDGRAASKLFLVCWVPATSKPASRMFYTSQKATVGAFFSGIEPLTAHSAADLEAATADDTKAAAAASGGASDDDEDDPFADDEEF